jgi:hypothetical protein
MTACCVRCPGAAWQPPRAHQTAAWRPESRSPTVTWRSPPCVMLAAPPRPCRQRRGLTATHHLPPRSAAPAWPTAWRSPPCVALLAPPQASRRRRGLHRDAPPPRAPLSLRSVGSQPSMAPGGALLASRSIELWWRTSLHRNAPPPCAPSAALYRDAPTPNPCGGPVPHRCNARALRCGAHVVSRIVWLRERDEVKGDKVRVERSL